MLFAHGSTHWFHSALGQFSITNHIKPATYGTFFVLMVVTMMSIRMVSVIARAHGQGAELKARESRLARHLITRSRQLHKPGRTRAPGDAVARSPTTSARSRSPTALSDRCKRTAGAVESTGS